MTRLCNILSSSFGCLAIVLLVLGVLAVSPYAWGDDPIPCGPETNCPNDTVCLDGFCRQAVPCTNTVNNRRCDVQCNGVAVPTSCAGTGNECDKTKPNCNCSCSDYVWPDGRHTCECQ
jgi:hypothetical protein